MRDIIGSALASAFTVSLHDETTCRHYPNPNIRSFDSPKPLTKRQKRRLRGKGAS